MDISKYNLLKKHKTISLVVILVLFVLGTINNESFNNSLRYGGWTFILFGICGVLIYLTYFTPKILMSFFWFIAGSLLLIFISLKLTKGLTYMMLTFDKKEIKGVIIEKHFGKGHKGMSDSWFYTYQYEVSKNLYKKRIFDDQDIYNLRDTISINYSNIFPVFSNVKK
jgi:energy-coupling factor transporter transmembrane protein EcfT